MIDKQKSKIHLPRIKSFAKDFTLGNEAEVYDTPVANLTSAANMLSRNDLSEHKTNQSNPHLQSKVSISPTHQKKIKRFQTQRSNFA